MAETYFDLEEGREEALESRACEAVVKWTGTPGDVARRMRADEYDYSGERRLTFPRLEAQGFPAALAAEDRLLTKQFGAKELFRSPDSLPFVKAFRERFEDLEPRSRSGVVGVVFAWTYVCPLMIVRNGKSPKRSGFVIREPDHGHLFVEQFETFVADLVGRLESPWWE